MSRHKLEYIYDTKFYRRFRLEFNPDTKEVISINKRDYKNTLYFYERYDTLDHAMKDVIWISDDNHVLELNNGVVYLSKHFNFFETLRILKTYERITSYTDYLIL